MAEQGWVLWYWGATFKGRGEYVRLVFEAAGVPYTENNDGADIMSHCDMQGHKGKGFPYPAKAPPVVTGPDGFNLSQTPAIVAALGKRFGLFPDAADEDHAMAVNLSVADFIAEGRLAFHAVDPVGSYKGQIEGTQPRIDWFVAERLPRWIEHLEHCLCSAADGGASFFFSGRLTYVDLVVYNAVTAAEVQFPAAWPDLAAHNPKLVAHKERIASLPKVAEYLASDRCRPWAGDSMM